MDLFGINSEQASVYVPRHDKISSFETTSNENYLKANIDSICPVIRFASVYPTIILYSTVSFKSTCALFEVV